MGADDGLKIDAGLSRILATEGMLKNAASGKKLDNLKNLEAELSALGESKKDSPQEIEKAATQFEALLMQQMFQAMWSGVKQDGVLGGGREEEFYRDMLNQALAEESAASQSIGIKAIIAKDIESIANKRQK